MTPQPSARAAFFLRRLLMPEFGGWLYSPVWRLALLAGLAAGFTRRFGGLLCSPVWRLALLACLAACSARPFGGLLCSPGGAFVCAPGSVWTADRSFGGPG